MLKTTRRKGAILLSLVTLLCGGCAKDKELPLTLRVGTQQNHTFVPVSAHAQYFELPGEGDILRLTWASYRLGCHEYRPPGPGDVHVTVTVRGVPGASFTETKLPWLGARLEEEEETKVPTALPYIRLGDEGRALPPGGGMQITTFQRTPHGLLEGELGFQDSGDGEVAGSALLGRFSVRLCHTELDPSRQPPEEEEKEKKKKKKKKK